MSEKFLTIKEVALNNNCPECFNNEGLQLTFKQLFKETAFYKSLTQDVSHEITCEKCETVIYPVQWRDDIERVFDYQKKAFQPRKSSFKLKKLFWILFIIMSLIIAGAVAFLFFKNSHLLPWQ